MNGALQEQQRRRQRQKQTETGEGPNEPADKHEKLKSNLVAGHGKPLGGRVEGDRIDLGAIAATPSKQRVKIEN